MKKGLILVFALITLAFTNKEAVVKSTMVTIGEESALQVKGKTNVNTFTCHYDVNQFKNPIPVRYALQNGKMVFSETKLQLKTNNFDCGGKAINKDFREILKADQYPHINLYLKEIKNVKSNTNVEVLVDIEIAGVKKDYIIPVSFKNNNQFYIKGQVGVCLTDFYIETPKKFFGLISIENEIEIDFNLLVQEN